MIVCVTPWRTSSIVCLANSRKRSGRCIAGKEFSSGTATEWIRPVSDRPSQELSEEEMRLVNGDYPKLLDLLTVPLAGDAASGYQTENRLIDPAFYWVREGQARYSQVRAAVDAVRRDLWVNGFSSAHGMNDRVPEQQAVSLNSSLLLIEPEGMAIRVGFEGALKRKVRGSFFLNARHYLLAITDPSVESAFLAKPDGEYPIGECLLTISLSSLFEGNCYKLIAAIFTDEQH